MQERTSLEGQLTGIGRIEREVEDQIGMIELGESEKDEGVVLEAENALKALNMDVAKQELEALLSGEADKFNTYLEVHAGAGGTESQDWASMLLRMYTRWAEKRGFKVEYLEETEGEEGHQIRNDPDQWPQCLRLVEDGRRRASVGVSLRSTQRAAAYVLRALRSSRWSMTASRSTSRKPMCAPIRCFAVRRPAVNKTESAVRLTHIPTECSLSGGRSQHKNRAQAWDSALYEIELKKREEKRRHQAAKTDIG